MKLKNKEICNYLLWVAFKLAVLLIFGELQFGSLTFYPMAGFDKIRDYDISEFLVYTIVPLLVILALKLKKADKNKS
jgi:uncharacterized membrane protein YoaT (DUF817 family)